VNWTDLGAVDWEAVVKIAAPLVGGFALGRLSKRLDARQEAKKLESARAPAFVLEPAELLPFGQAALTLRNVGDVTATGVTILEPASRTNTGPYILDRPQGKSLRPTEGIRFLVSGWMALPPHLDVTCGQIDGPTAVAVPTVAEMRNTRPASGRT